MSTSFSLKDGMSKKQNKISKRKKYSDQSLHFMQWTQQMKSEKNWIGRLLIFFDKRNYLKQLMYIFLIASVLSYFLYSDFNFSYKVKKNDIVAADIKSPFSFTFVDEIETENKKIEADKSVLPVFDYDSQVFEGKYSNIYKAFDLFRKKVNKIEWPREEIKKEELVKDFLTNKGEFDSLLGAEIDIRSFEWLVENKFSVSIENILIKALSSWSSLKIIDASESSLPGSTTQILLRNQIATEEYSTGVSTLKSAFVNIRDPESLALTDIRGLSRFKESAKKNLKKIAKKIISPNVMFNLEETKSRKKLAKESVLPVKVSIKRNQVIVAEGQKVQEGQLKIINEINNRRENQQIGISIILATLLIFLSVTVLITYATRLNKNKLKVQFKDITAMGLVTLLVVVLSKVYLFLADLVIPHLGFAIPSGSIIYAAPAVAGAMIIGLLITYGEVVWVYTLVMAFVMGLLTDFNSAFMAMSLVGGIAAARGVHVCKKRNDIYLAGLVSGLVCALVVALVLSLQNLNYSSLWEVLAWSVPAAFLGGISSSFIAMITVPLLESLFNYTTDIKLLELSSLNHPVMKKLALKAQGTYHHCLAVGTMVETAAEQIDANPLLAKVMAYYHDIGKMEHAHYFIENQHRGKNPHDQVTPHMSKTILVAHVKDGAELGLKYKLGKPIIDGILQHHGTSLIRYFYHKAVSEQDEAIDTIKESEFRYPGPKPQFREAALVMLGDSIEAAARSIDDPTGARLSQLVKDVIKGKFIDGQLDECDLTLKDLSIIERSFTKTLLSVYHQRIEYPSENQQKNDRPKKDKQKNDKVKSINFKKS